MPAQRRAAADGILDPLRRVESGDRLVEVQRPEAHFPDRSHAIDFAFSVPRPLDRHAQNLAEVLMVCQPGEHFLGRNLHGFDNL
jgi:hypothetical protein